VKCGARNERRLSPERLQAILNQAETTIKRLRVDLPELVRRREHDVSDGYPSTSMGAGSGNAGTVSNPTMRSALAVKEEHPVARAIDIVLRGISDLDEVST
jgi:hypothetical protein